MGTLGSMSFGVSGHWGKMGNLGQIGISNIGGMGGLGQIDIWGKWALCTDGRWGKWGQMGTRKNDINKWALGAYEHQRKIRANGHFAINVYGYRWLMSTWRKGAPGQMNTGANGHWGK